MTLDTRLSSLSFPWTCRGSNDPDTGDIYCGLDGFGRVKDCCCYDDGFSADVAQLQYGYDRASNRLWRADTVAQAAGKDFDELYSYDGHHRLQTMARGLLDAQHSTLDDQTYGQCWNLDATGNWTVIKVADGGLTRTELDG